MTDLLPEDALANIIRRLAPRYLALSWCVCKTWCTIIDAHNLLRMDLLPHSVCGLFINFDELSMSEFLSRPSKDPTISGKFEYLPSAGQVIDHCNGLLLLHECVVNPVTRQWALLPPCPSPNMPEHFIHRKHLAFDPTLSSHYEVFLIPQVMYNSNSNIFGFGRNLDPAIEELEWSPSPCILQVFSSRTKLWEERLFVREGEAAGNVADMRLDWPYVQDNAVYWRGVLYINYRTKFVMRISLSNDKYQVIKPPVGFEWFESTDFYLGKSEKGVYCALYYLSSFSIYILDESDGKMEWILKLPCNIQSQGIDRPGPWTLQDINYNWYIQYEDSMEEKFEWDSDSDDVIENKSRGGYTCRTYINFLGFHPYKEVVFLSDTLRR